MRHPAVAVAPGVCYGRLDVAVADAGAVTALAARLAGFGGTVWTSPARRCRVVAAALGPHVVDPRLQELDFGAWEGLAWDAIPREWLDAWAADPWRFAPPGGESARGLRARVAKFHAMLLAHGQDCVVVAHGGPLKFLSALCAGEAPDPLAPAPPLGTLHRVIQAPVSGEPRTPG